MDTRWPNIAVVERFLAAFDRRWPAGTQLAAWCVAHYRLTNGRIVDIEQHDCYERPSAPLAWGRRRSTRVRVFSRCPRRRWWGLAQDALAERGIEDEGIAAGQFNPRGHTGGLFAGGLAGAEAGSVFGGVAEDVGLAAGSLAGMHAADAASGLPSKMLVAVSGTAVYGFAAASRRSAPTGLVFQVPRADLTDRRRGDQLL